ncbi:hypothetical protein BBJ28_00002425 [Nothophytophthora sp. Chile5]|nr:hypothetical protein BBJ28_00002425 [Nothophytophthora sp. Chile5]
MMNMMEVSDSDADNAEFLTQRAKTPLWSSAAYSSALTKSMKAMISGKRLLSSRQSPTALGATDNEKDVSLLAAFADAVARKDKEMILDVLAKTPRALGVFAASMADITRLPDNQGNLPLHCLCINPTCEVGMIQQLGASIDSYSAVNDNQDLPVHILCQNAKLTPEMLRLMLQAHPTAIYALAKDFKLPVQYLVDNAASSTETTALLISGPASYRHRYEFLSATAPCICITQGSELVYIQTNVAMDSNSAANVLVTFYSSQTAVEHEHAMLLHLKAADDFEGEHGGYSPAVYEAFEGAKRRVTLRSTHVAPEDQKGDVSVTLDYALVTEAPLYTLESLRVEKVCDSDTVRSIATEIANCLLFWHCQARMVHGNLLLERLAPWSEFVGHDQSLHLICSLTDDVLAPLIAEVDPEFRPFLQRTLRVADGSFSPSFAISETSSHKIIGDALEQKTNCSLVDGPAGLRTAKHAQDQLEFMKKEQAHLRHTLLATKSQLRDAEQMWTRMQTEAQELRVQLATVTQQKQEVQQEVQVFAHNHQAMTLQLHMTVQMLLNLTPLARKRPVEYCSRAVETYLRNFEGEKARYQEILEITLCYGVQCLAQNFSLKGLSCNELRTITAYDAARNRDFYVRNASRKHVSASNDGATERTPAELRAKPPHSWRDGEAELADFPDPSKAASERPRAASERTEKSPDALYSLPPAFDEIDFHTKLLGKPLVDLAWKTFAGRAGSQVITRSELEERFCRIDQRKTSVTIPAVELPVSSFVEFLDSYVTECVRQSQRTSSSADGFSGEAGESIDSVEGEEDGAPISHSRRGRATATAKCSAMGNTRRGSTTNAAAARKQRPVYAQQQSTPTPRPLAHVQSKIQPELDARRQKLLRVKKTQSQRMAESLARARLAEYEARRELQDVRDRRLGPKKMPLNEITKGERLALRHCVGWIALTKLRTCCCCGQVRLR